MEKLPLVAIEDVIDWEEYIALRDADFEAFQEYYEGKSPVEAIGNYQWPFWL